MNCQVFLDHWNEQANQMTTLQMFAYRLELVSRLTTYQRSIETKRPPYQAALLVELAYGGTP